MPFNPVDLSVYWSGLFGCDDRNSIRVGSKTNKYGQRMVYLSSNRRKAWYLSKYIGKSRSKAEMAGKSKIRAFAMDAETSAACEPGLFLSRSVMETRAVTVIGKKKLETYYHDLPTGEIIFENEKGELISPDGISWRDVGHGVKVGFEIEKSRNE